MKNFILLAIIFFCFNSFAFDKFTPEWVTRNNIKQKHGEYTWFLGIHEDEKWEYAEMGAESNARKNIIEYVYPVMTLRSKSNYVQGMKEKKHKVTVEINKKDMPLPIHKKRYYSVKEDGHFVLYVDLAVLNDEVRIVKKTNKPIKYDYDIAYKRLKKNTWSGNKEEESKKSLKDYHHTFYWAPLRSDESTAFTFNYEYSFLNRLLGLEFGFMQSDNSEDSYKVRNETGTYHKQYKKTQFHLNFKVYSNDKLEFKVGAGKISFFTKKELEDTYSSDFKLEQQFDGSVYSLRVNSLNSPKSYWGYTITVQHESLSGTDYDNKDTDVSQTTASAGFFWRF